MKSGMLSLHIKNNRLVCRHEQAVADAGVDKGDVVSPAHSVILVDVAKEKGISGFTAEVLRNNRRMLGIFHRSGFDVRTQADEDAYFLSFSFDKKDIESNPEG